MKEKKTKIICKMELLGKGSKILCKKLYHSILREITQGIASIKQNRILKTKIKQ